MFKIRVKSHWQISSRSFVESFIKIGPSVWAVEITHTDRHTQRQTDRQTDRQTEKEGEGKEIHTETQTDRHKHKLTPGDLDRQTQKDRGLGTHKRVATVGGIETNG